MPTETVRADWVESQVFLLRDHVRDHAGFPVVMTQPNGVLGADLLPMSLIGCALWDVVAILRKQRQHVTGAQASAESVRDDQPPWRFREIRIRYRIMGRSLKPDRVRRAIELTETKYCSVYATLHDAVHIVSEVEIVSEDV